MSASGKELDAPTKASALTQLCEEMAPRDLHALFCRLSPQWSNDRFANDPSEAKRKLHEAYVASIAGIALRYEKVRLRRDSEGAPDAMFKIGTQVIGVEIKTAFEIGRRWGAEFSKNNAKSEQFCEIKDLFTDETIVNTIADTIDKILKEKIRDKINVFLIYLNIPDFRSTLDNDAVRCAILSGAQQLNAQNFGLWVLWSNHVYTYDIAQGLQAESLPFELFSVTL